MLHWAAENGHIPVIDALATVGANINAADLVEICVNFMLCILKLLLQYQWTPLHVASLHGQRDSVRCLLRCGADGAALDSVITAYFWLLPLVKR
jgi:ankyrin repeat protein